MDLEALNPEIKLEAGSLYIRTQMIVSDGFHWSLFATDAQGRSTKHHWAADPDGVTAEKYLRIVEPARTYTANALVLAYYKVDGYRPPEDPSILVAIFDDTFAGRGYKTVRENRRNGLTCRTWLLKALATMQDAGVIVRREPVSMIEGIVKQHSALVEAKAIGGQDDSTEVLTI